jgi:hypothetical protein
MWELKPKKVAFSGFFKRRQIFTCENFSESKLVTFETFSKKILLDKGPAAVE